MRRDIPSGAGKDRAVAIHDRSPRGRVFPPWRGNPRLEGGRRPAGGVCGDCKRRYCLYTGIFQHSAAYDPSHHAKLRKGTSPYGKADNRSTSRRLNWLALGRRARPEGRDGRHDAGTLQSVNFEEFNRRRRHYSCRWKLVVDIAADCEGVVRGAGGVECAPGCCADGSERETA